MAVLHQKALGNFLEIAGPCISLRTYSTHCVTPISSTAYCYVYAGAVHPLFHEVQPERVAGVAAFFSTTAPLKAYISAATDACLQVAYFTMV